MVTNSPPFIEPPALFRGAFRTDVLARSLYAEGAGIARAVPCGVAVPIDTDDLSVLVRWARSSGYSLIPRGSGSGMAGGAVGDGIMVDVSRFQRIGPVDVGARRITVETGALRGQIDAAARRHGLRFPVDPSSGAFCTIGGMTAANAAGARSLRFGATRAWVSALHCVFDDGSAAWIRRDAPLPMNIPAVARLVATLDQLRQHANPSALVHPGVRKESSGYAVAASLAPGGHLLDILIGSEGTLAIFTEVELRLHPVAGASATVLAMFSGLEQATAFATQARALGATACELLDRTFLDVAETDGPTGISSSADAVLIVEIEGDSPVELVHTIARIADACQTHGALDVVTATDDEARQQIWALRHAASPILARLAPRLRSMQFIEDGCVPPDRFPDYVRGVRSALTRFDMPGVIFGHAGDAHAHVNPLVDVTKTGWRDRVHGILNEVTELTARLGGTMSGEHGDGRLRVSLLPRVWNAEALAAFTNIKHAADPAGVFNQGCKIAAHHSGVVSTQDLGVLRYDPDAVPLDPFACVVLDDIERTRSWHRFRLAE